MRYAEKVGEWRCKLVELRYGKLTKRQMASMNEDQGAAGFFMMVRSDVSVVTSPFVYATDDRILDYLGVICQRGFEANRVVAKLEGFAIADFDPSCMSSVICSADLTDEYH